MKNKTNTIFLSSLITLLAVGAVYIFLLLSFYNFHANLNEMYSLSANDKAKLSELKKIESNLNITLADKDRLSNLFIKQESIVNFIQEIEATMKKLRLTGSIDSVAEENPSELANTNKEKLAISLSALGDWAGVASFIGLIEKLPYKSTIESVSLQYGESQSLTDTKATSTAKAQWKISLRMYALAEKSIPQDINTNEEN